jgi:hypothetical protein
MTLKGADTVISGLTNLADSLLKTAGAGDALAGAEQRLELAKLQLLKPLTVMLTQTTQLGANLLDAAAHFGEMAAAEGICAAATSVLDAGLALLASPLVLIAGLLATLTAGAIIAAKSLSAFSDSEDTIARLAIRMRNLGNVFPVKELTAFSGKLGQQLGIDDELIAKTAALGAGFGLSRKQIENAIPKVLDVAVANKVSPDEVLEKIFQASKGRTRGLIALGIDPAKLKGDLHDVNNLIDQIGAGFAGTAAAFRNTLPGTVDALKVSVGNLFEALGRFISPVVVPLLNLLIKGIDHLTNALDRIATFLHLPTAADIGGGDASKIAFKGDPEQTALMQQTADNTKKASDALVKSVLGGPGAIARQAFTLRDAKLAFRL